MRKSTRRLSVLTAVVLPMVTLTTAALADDDKTYPGAMCRVLSPITNLADMPAIGANGSMLNNSRAEQVWICPIVRDHVTEDPEFARMTVQENGTSRVSCEFVARGWKGEQFAQRTPDKRDREILQTSPLQLLVWYTWGGGDGDVLDEVPDHGYYFFLCRVPGAILGPAGTPQQFSGVITYKVSEND